jgi:phage/plasmid-like protein (TIGR03299 family)
MPADFVTGMFVRSPAWHGMGVVLDEYPTRAEAIVLSGQNFRVEEIPLFRGGARLNVKPESRIGTILSEHGGAVQTDDGMIAIEGIADYKGLVKHIVNPFDPADTEFSDRILRLAGQFGQEVLMPGHPTDGKLMHVASSTYGVVQNETGWDIMDALVGVGVKIETAIVLKDGAQCSILGFLDEPYTIPGDDSAILPYVNVSWSHDGSGAVSARPTEIRTVCWNTQSYAEMLGQRRGNEFTFRHTKNVNDHIEDAKMAFKGIRDDRAGVEEAATELGQIKVTAKQRDLYIEQVIPLPPTALVTERVMNNIDDARTMLRDLFSDSNPSIPEAHKLTGWGLFCGATEYLDHLRGYRNRDTLYGRQLMRDEPMKKNLRRLIEEVAVA